MRFRQLCRPLPLLLTLSAACGGSQSAPPEPQFSEGIVAELTAVTEETHAEFDIPGTAIGLWVDGVGSFTHTVGFADPESGAPMSLDHHVRIGSVTKTFTGTLILQLAGEGKLSLDDTVDQYFGDAVPGGDRITLTHLLNMTSGLANYTFDPEFQSTIFGDPNVSWTPESLVQIGWNNTAANCPYVGFYCFEPGTAWAYCNTNTVMLGMIVEQVTGQSYAEVLRERIVEPLGLKHTFVAGSSLPEPFARGFTPQGVDPDSGEELRDATDWNPSWGFAVGDIASTLSDLRVYGEALGTGALLTSAMQDARLTKVTVPPNTPDAAYMLGIGYKRGWLGHGGELPGYNAIVYYRPDIEATLVAVMTRDSVEIDGKPAGPVYVLMDRIIDIAAREAPLGDPGQATHYEEDPFEN